MNKESGRKIIAERVQEFEKNKAILTKKGHGETNIRSNYIDIMFKALGWNMKSHYEVVREFSQRDKSTDGGTKKVDYAFKINGKLKFFIEAKEASVDLEKDKSAIYQAKRYAYSSNGKAPIVILTDFEEFRVFNVIKAPLMDNTDRELLKSHTMRYTDYLEKWDLLWDTFSREAVENGSLDKLRGKIDKNTKTMDVDFLEQITNWRELLAKNVAIRNENLNVDEINESVQRILDRLVFIRNLEDREIEPENTLLDKTKKSENIYKSLIPIFNSLNTTYNGLLFKKHFSEDIDVDDKTIHDIIRQMNYPVSPFQFDVIEPEILGRIYEKFLGSKIRLTDSHRAKIEEKIEVRKAGGVYYTPEYIVEYIVQNTVGKKVEGLTPEEIKNIKIVDPACGSGSFLIGAYSYLLDYHQKWYTENQKDKTYQADWYKTTEGEIKVSLEKRGGILRNNIFGVDIDKEATEVAIMSLYLKMLDDGFDKGERDLFFVKGSILPDMNDNVKCGNSLIAPDYFDGRFDYDLQELKEIKPFDWTTEFPKAFSNTGFDCVIGNPPYIRIQTLQEFQPSSVAYYKNKFESTSIGNTDIYIAFLEKALQLINKEGLTGYILPHKFFQGDLGTGIRKIISKNKSIIRIVNFGEHQIFENATTYTCLFFMSGQARDSFDYYKIESAESIESSLKNISFDNISSKILEKDKWNFISESKVSLFNKLESMPIKLGDITRKIFVGLQTSADKIYVLKEVEKNNSDQNIFRLYSQSLDKTIEIERGLLKPFLMGKDVKRYEEPINESFVIFPYLINNNKAELMTESYIKNNFPLGWDYLQDNKKLLEAREKGKFKKTWWQYGRLNNLTEFDVKKIMTPEISLGCNMTFDSIGAFYHTTKVYSIVFNKDQKEEDFYFLSILNSKLLWFYLKSTGYVLRGGFFTFKTQYLSPFPIKTINFNIEEEKEQHNNLVNLVAEILKTKKGLFAAKSESDIRLLESKIESIEKMINKIVYNLYNLTNEEINIIESN